MPIKLKKTNIQFGIDKPDEGFIILGFNEQGELVYKDDNGYYGSIIPSVPTGNFVDLETDYFTIGYRLSGQYKALYSYAQGENNVSSGYTSMSMGKSAIAQGDYSTSKGEYTLSSGKYSFVNGKGMSNANKLFAEGENSFVHSYAEIASGTYANYSVILGGKNHNIGTNGVSSSIIGGNNNTLNTSNTSIIACDNISSTVSNTVYVPRLKLIDGTYSTPEDGTIFYDGTDIKARLNGTNVSLSVQTTGLVTSVSTTAPISNTGTATAPIITMLSATSSRDGYLTSTNWSTFNNKVSSVSASGALSSSGGSTPSITHLTTSGYKHIPSGGSTNQFLKYSSDGTAVWSDLPTGLSVSNNTNNRVLTATGGNTINGESNLTFDGSTLNIIGNIDISNSLIVDGSVNFNQFDYGNVVGYISQDDKPLIVSTSGEVKSTLLLTSAKIAGNGDIYSNTNMNIQSVSRTSEGDYTITYKNAYEHPPACFVTLQYDAANSHRFVWVKTSTTTTAEVKIEYPDDTDDDRIFSFMAIGWLEELS